MSGWIGDREQLLHYLATVRCDRDAQGNFCVDGSIYAGLGGDELVVSDDAVYYCGGEPKALAAGLRGTSYGASVRVF